MPTASDFPPLTLHQLLLECQVLPRIDLISSQLINIDAHVDPAASTHTHGLGREWESGEAGRSR